MGRHPCGADRGAADRHRLVGAGAERGTEPARRAARRSPGPDARGHRHDQGRAGEAAGPAERCGGRPRLDRRASPRARRRDPRARQPGVDRPAARRPDRGRQGDPGRAGAPTRRGADRARRRAQECRELAGRAGGATGRRPTGRSRARRPHRCGGQIDRQRARADRAGGRGKAGSAGRQKCRCECGLRGEARRTARGADDARQRRFLGDCLQGCRTRKECRRGDRGQRRGTSRECGRAQDRARREPDGDRHRPCEDRAVQRDKARSAGGEERCRECGLRGEARRAARNTHDARQRRFVGDHRESCGIGKKRCGGDCCQRSGACRQCGCAQDRARREPDGDRHRPCEDRAVQRDKARSAGGEERCRECGLRGEARRTARGADDARQRRFLGDCLQGCRTRKECRRGDCDQRGGACRKRGCAQDRA